MRDNHIAVFIATTVTRIFGVKMVLARVALHNLAGAGYFDAL